MEIATTEIPVTSRAISSQLSREAKSTVAPAFFAAMIFSEIPPIGPTVPLAEIVPEPATFLPCKISSGVSRSISPIVKIKPPLGPPTWVEKL